MMLYVHMYDSNGSWI